MARTLTASATTEKNKTDGVEPITLLKIEWGGGVGTLWFADHDIGNADASAWNHADGVVDDWGQIASRTSLFPRPAVGQVTIRLVDAAHALHGYLGDQQIENATVTVYQHFAGNVEADLLVIFKGVVSGRVSWEEGPPRALVLPVTDTGSHYDRDWASFAHKDDFSDVLGAHEGRMLPLVYGRVKKASTVFVAAGARGRLLREVRLTDTTEKFYIEGGEDFPQGTPVTIRVGHEHVTGTFSGIEFTATARGVAIASGTISGTHGNLATFASNFGGVDGQYVGYFLKVTAPQQSGSTGVQYRRIIRYGAGGEIEVAGPFKYRGWVNDFGAGATDYYFGCGQNWAVPANTGASIVTQARPHQEGERVAEVLNEYVYILSDRPSTRVDAVYGWGRKLARSSVLDDMEGLQPGAMGSMTYGVAPRENGLQPLEAAGLNPPGDYLGSKIPERDDWVAIDPAHYSVDRNDNQYAATIGHNCTTVTFTGLPPALMGLYDFGAEELFVDMQGLDTDGDGTGTLIENPAAVIKDFLETVGGVDSGDTDDASFTDAENRMGGMAFGFSLTQPMRLCQACQALAFQCRCSLNWDDGEACLRWLRNGPGTSVATITDSMRILDSVVKKHTDFEAEVYSEVLARWQQENEKREVAVADATAESAHGRKVLSIDCWGHNTKDNVKTIANFWLRRLKDIWTVYQWRSHLDTVQLQREDTVGLTFSTYAPAGTEVTITEITHRPGKGAAGRLDEIEYAAIGWYCDTTCEAFCESAGCETAMEVSACSGACETGCQGSCELTCTAAADAICITTVMAWDCEWVENADLFGCDTSGTETGCASGCQFACTVAACETCQTGCETCETGCETCETGCETCETGCETCETGCETGCQDCQTGCETCETGCETVCQDCQILCQIGAEGPPECGP